MIDIDITKFIEDKYIIHDDDGWRFRKDTPQWVRKEAEEYLERLRLEEDQEER